MVYRTNYKGYRLETHIDLVSGNFDKLYIIRKDDEFITAFPELDQVEEFIQNNS